MTSDLPPSGLPNSRDNPAASAAGIPSESSLWVSVHHPSKNRYDHLRAKAAAQKSATVTRLQRAIATLQGRDRAISGPAIQEVGGPSYVVIRRNPEAYALYREHSAFHTGLSGSSARTDGMAEGIGVNSELEAHSEPAGPTRHRTDARWAGALQAADSAPNVVQHERPENGDGERRSRAGPALPYDPLLNHKRAQLVRALRAAWQERDAARAAQVVAEERYRCLLEAHQQCGELIARLQAALVNDEFRRRITDFTALEQVE